MFRRYLFRATAAASVLLASSEVYRARRSQRPSLLSSLIPSSYVTATTAPPPPPPSSSSSSPSPSVAEAAAPAAAVEHYAYVIVGGGTAAYNAWLAIRDEQPTARVLIVADEPQPFYERPPLSKELWAVQDDAEARALRFKNWRGESASVFYDTQRMRDDAHTTLRVAQRVTGLDATARAVQIDARDVVYFDALLLATGGRPRALLGVAHEAAPLVDTFRGANDFLRLRQAADEAIAAAQQQQQQPPTFLVVGGGFLGTELAAALATRYGDALRVVQAYPEPAPLAAILPSYLAAHVARALQRVGVDARPNTLVDGVDVMRADDAGDERRAVTATRGDERPAVTATLSDGAAATVTATLSDGARVEAARVVAALGLVPNDELARDAELEIDATTGGGVRVSSELAARRHIFAAGDVASYYSPLLGRRRVEHYAHAAASGRCAGLNMTGKALAFDTVPSFWGAVPGAAYEAVGKVDARLETVGVWDETAAADRDGVDRYKRGIVYYLEHNKVVGVLLWNVFNRAEQATKVVEEKRLYYDRKLLKQFIDMGKE